MRMQPPVRKFIRSLTFAFLVAGTGAGAAGGTEDAGLEKILRAPALQHPLVFVWGSSFQNVVAELKDSRVLERRPDQELAFVRGDVEYRYSFFRPLAAAIRNSPPPGDTAAGGGVVDGRGGRLFAVTILVPGIALHGETGRELVSLLEAGYGRATNRTATHFDMESEGTSVRVYLENYRRVLYLRRVTFVSKRLARERNRQYQGAIRVGEVRVSRPEQPVWDFSGQTGARAQPVASLPRRKDKPVETNGR